jgi:FPC/CPF motif-containing protein YcgG
MEVDNELIIESFHQYISDEQYPCVAARAAAARKNIECLVVEHMECPKDDRTILEFLYRFISEFRKSQTLLHSAAVIFRWPETMTEETFDTLLWHRLQALSNLDAVQYGYDKRVSARPSDATFSFSLGEEAFFIIGMHRGSSRPSRQFHYPTIVFNPHAQFEELRKTNKYEKMKHIVRQRDILYAGSINPMLADFGESSEVYQYSGRHYNHEWTCPLKITHAGSDDHPTAK